MFTDKRTRGGPVTRWRYRLWFGLAAVWSLLLIQALFPLAHSKRSFVSAGAIVYYLVLVGLVAGGVHFWRRRREG